MPPLVRSLLAMLIAALAALLLISATEAGIRALFPPPATFSVADPAQVEAYVRALPTLALVLLLTAYAVAGVLGGWLAARLAPYHPFRHALLLGAILVGSILATVLSRPTPGLFEVLSLLLPLPMAVLGARLAPPIGPHES